MSSNLRLALYQPDMPTNTGSLMRLGACLGIALDIIEPCGFVWDDKRLRRVAMDYIDKVSYQRHTSWESFCAIKGSRRVVLLSTHASQPYGDYAFRPDDILMLGRESAGVPQHIHESVDGRVLIPMQQGLRSLNIALAAAMVLGEALRQTGGFPPPNTL